MPHPVNLTNAVYQFAVETKNAAAISAALYQADVQESDADPVKAKKTVRVGSYEAVPQYLSDGSIGEENGYVNVEFMVKPDSQSLASRVAARETAHQMALEFVAAVFDKPKLNGRVCNVDVTGKSNGFRLIKTERYQVSILELRINPRGEG